MINSKKKGFTIVELVIVIAVIAVLAAVLIPTFSNLVKKANMSADQQAVRQMNTALAIETRPEDIEGAVTLLDKAGYNAFESLSPVSKGYNFYWVASNNTIVLVDENLKVVFPANLEGEDLTEKAAKGEAFNLKGGFIADSLENNDDLLEAIDKGQSVTLKEDIVIEQPLYVNKGETITIDLGGNELKTANSNVQDGDGKNTKSDYALEIRGTVTIKSGTISSRGIMVKPGGHLIVGEDVTINATDKGGGYAINCQGGEVTIDGATINVLEGDQKTDPITEITYDPAAIRLTGGKITIKDGTFNTPKTAQYAFRIEGGELVIDTCNVSAWRGCIYALGGNITINGGSYTAGGNGGGWVIASAGGTINVNGGTFTNISNASNISTSETEDGKGIINGLN